MRKVYIHIPKPDTFQKSRQFTLCFYSQKSRHFTLRDFHEVSYWHLCIYKKHDTLRYVTFYTKSQTLRKKQDNFRFVFFIYKNSDTLHYAILMEFLNLAEGGGNFINKKQCTLRQKFICKKMHLALRFYIQKSRHFVSHFYMQKKCTLRYVLIYVIYIKLYSDT